MKHLIFEKGIKIESNTYYTARGSEYHIYLNDSTLSGTKEYMATSKLAGPTLNIGFLLKDIENTTIDFGGAKLIFHGRIAPFVLDNCQNVTIKNCSITYDRPYYTMADILEIDETHLKLHIDDGYSYRVEGNRMFVYGNSWENGLNVGDMLFKIMSPVTHEPIENLPIILALIGDEIFTVANPAMPITQLLAEKDGNNIILHGKFPKEWANTAGNKLVMTHERRDKHTILSVGGKDLSIENVRVIYGASMAFVAIGTENITLRRFNMYHDEENTGYIMNNADAIHTFNCKGHIVIDDCRIEALLDDQINIHNEFLKVAEVGENYIISEIPGVSVKPELNIIKAGDEILVFDSDFCEHSKFRITKVIRTENGYIAYTDGDLSKVKSGELIEPYSGNCDVTIKNCCFAKSYAQIRLQTRGKIVVDNCIFDKDFRAFLLSGDAEYWFEGSPVRDLTIQNCKFLRTPCLPLTVTSGVKGKNAYHQNIKLTNNEVACETLIIADSASGIFTNGNINTMGKKLKAELLNCKNIEITDAEIISGESLSGV